MAEKLQAAKWGAQAHVGEVGKLPVAFPRTMGPNALKYVQEVVDSGLTCDMMGRFEKAFAEALGVKHCIGTPGCTPALHVLALACGFEPGDEIIVSPVTDYGTVQGWIAEGIIPVFADTEPGTINFCPETIAACITSRTRAILCVHMTGLINDMDGINALAKKHGLLVFEDVCQAVFGEYKGRVAGTLADAACFSFDAEKTMGSDTGGCMVTNNTELYERARYMGQSRGAVMQPHFGRLHADIGYAYRMPGCTAAICLAQLEIVREQVAHRDAMVRALYRKLAEIPGITPLPIPEHTNVYSCWMPGFNIESGMFTCSTEAFASQLAEAGIPGAGMGEYYLMPAALTCLHEKVAESRYPYCMPPASHKHTYSSESCPVASEFLKTFIRWSTFCEKYQPEHVDLAAQLVAEVADRNRV
ncbi:MAG: aminotransferase class V-fold PLP-dependent enzyme [Candidatus Hydrogenedentes bacterium]|nr:aminotransferase class V-fold PLP-dependent enzyme [Candidatus Hydrogenedentota bacterium]